MIFFNLVRKRKGVILGLFVFLRDIVFKGIFYLILYYIVFYISEKKFLGNILLIKLYIWGEINNIIFLNFWFVKDRGNVFLDFNYCLCNSF